MEGETISGTRSHTGLDSGVVLRQVDLHPLVAPAGVSRVLAVLETHAQLTTSTETSDLEYLWRHATHSAVVHGQRKMLHSVLPSHFEL